jgi:hypothetical protein
MEAISKPTGGGENVSEKRATGWVGTPLDTDKIDPHGLLRAASPRECQDDTPLS